MGIRFSCPNGHKLNVKTFLAGKRAICPDCGAKVIVPSSSEPIAEPSLNDSPGIAAIGRPAPQRFVEDATPSVVIAVAEAELPTAVYIDEPPATILEELPDSIIAATTPAAVIVQQTTDAAQPTYDPQRERTRRNQMLMAVALLFVVVVLAGILIWVLKRGTSTAPTSEPVPTKTTNKLPNRLSVPTQLKV